MREGKEAGFFMDENKFDEPIKFLSQKHGLRWLLVKAQILQESQFNPRAKWPRGTKNVGA